MRTQYFANVNNGSNVKRLKDGKVEYFSENIHNKWMPSFYHRTEVESWKKHRVTRDQARKLFPAAFR